MALGPGTMLSSTLRLERELGSGAMGTVWVAENLSLGAKVAVKVLRAHTDDAGLRKRFEREARSAAQLDSPHVVKVFDYGISDDGEPYIVMELLRGEDLQRRLERGVLSANEARTIVLQVCRALSAAHKQDVIHRDIKPANIFLIENEDEMFVKVVDFGIAKMADHEMGMTATGALMGTPHYMSPEQLLDPSRVDHRTDLWALAIVAYHCLTGVVPFDGETVGAISIKINDGNFDPLCERRPELPAALETWMRKALLRDADARFQNTRELARAFDDAVADVADMGMDDTLVQLSAGSAPSQTAGGLSTERHKRGNTKWLGIGTVAVAAAVLAGAAGIVAVRSQASLETSNPTAPGTVTTGIPSSAEPSADASAEHSSEPSSEPSNEASASPASSVAAPSSPALKANEQTLRSAMLNCWRSYEGSAPRKPRSGMIVDIYKGEPGLTSDAFGSSPQFKACAQQAAVAVAKKLHGGTLRVEIVLPGERVFALPTNSEVHHALLDCWTGNEGGQSGTHARDVSVVLTSSSYNMNGGAGAPGFRNCAGAQMKALRNRMTFSDKLKVAVLLPAAP
jgi:serine/threonine protein kinase